MIIVVGLGNIGEKYKGHRHNVGFQVLDILAQEKGVDFSEKKIFSAEITEVGEMLLVKPQTFMNHSGESVRKLLKQYPEAKIVVLYDDISISLGQVKCSFDRGAGGHNGLQNIIDMLGSKDFFRIRFGVRPVHTELEAKIAPPNGFQNFLLSDFAPFEKEKKEEGIKKTLQILDELPKKTFEQLMNEFN